MDKVSIHVSNHTKKKHFFLIINNFLFKERSLFVVVFVFIRYEMNKYSICVQVSTIKTQLSVWKDRGHG